MINWKTNKQTNNMEVNKGIKVRKEDEREKKCLQARKKWSVQIEWVYKMCTINEKDIQGDMVDHYKKQRERQREQKNIREYNPVIAR